MMEFKTYRYEDIDKEVWDAWEASCKKWRVYPFNSPAWARASIKGAGTSRELFLLVAIDDKQIVGFLPYRYHTRRFLKVPLIKYCRPWSDMSPSQWFLLIPGKSITYYRELIHGLCRQLPSWDRCVAARIQHSRDIETAFEQYLQSSSYDVTYNIEDQAEIKGFDNFDSFLSGLPSKKRQQYRKSVRELVDTGKCQILHYHVFDDTLLVSIKERVMSIYRESWKTESTEELNSLLYEKGYHYFSSLVDEYAEIDGLHVMILKLDEDDAAFYVGVHQYNKYVLLQTAFKDKYKRLSVGQLIQLENFRYTIENNYITNNTLAAQKYKRRIIKDIVTQNMYVINNKTIVGFILSLIIALKFIIRPGRQMMKRM